MKDYKDTLLMGKTNFEMRGNLGQKEPLIQEKWNQNHVYEKVLEKNKVPQISNITRRLLVI